MRLPTHRRRHPTFQTCLQVFPIWEPLWRKSVVPLWPWLPHQCRIMWPRQMATTGRKTTIHRSVYRSRGESRQIDGWSLRVGRFKNVSPRKTGRDMVMTASYAKMGNVREGDAGVICTTDIKNSSLSHLSDVGIDLTESYTSKVTPPGLRRFLRFWIPCAPSRWATNWIVTSAPPSQWIRFRSWRT